MNPLYDPLPDRIEVNGSSYRIVMDFKDWIRVADMLGELFDRKNDERGEGAAPTPVLSYRYDCVQGATNAN